MTDRPALRRRPLTNPQPVMTLAEIGKAMGITPERVRQLEKRALVKLRRGLTKRGYTREDIIF